MIFTERSKDITGTETKEDRRSLSNRNRDIREAITVIGFGVTLATAMTLFTLETKRGKGGRSNRQSRELSSSSSAGKEQVGEADEGDPKKESTEKRKERLKREREQGVDPNTSPHVRRGVMRRNDSGMGRKRRPLNDDKPDNYGVFRRKGKKNNSS